MDTQEYKREIALVLDFDGTVSPGVMLSPLFALLKIDADNFWRQTQKLTEAGYDRELSYLHTLLQVAEESSVTLSNKLLRTLGKNLTFYRGFPEVISFLKTSISAVDAELCVYVITAGLEEMVLGSLLGPYIKKCWGCKYAEDSSGRLSHPMQIVNSANKVEKLYLIKRQYLNHADTYKVNLVEPKDDVIPWKNIIFVADGETDVPAFEVVRRGGGFTIAIQDKNATNSGDNMITGRTHATLQPDYSQDSLLTNTLTKAIFTATKHSTENRNVI